MNKDHPYTAEDIRRYLQGEMPEAEMHALEKAALDDPMLADAIEGFQASIAAHGEMKSQQDVEALNRTFAERFHKTPIRQFPVWQVAAAAVVIIIAGIATFNYLNKPDEQLAIHQTDTARQSVPQKENVSQYSDTPSTTAPSQDVASTKPSVKKSQNNKNKPATASEIADADNTDSQRQEEETTARTLKQSDSVSVTAPETAAPQANREITSNAPSSAKGSNAFHVITGRVVNANMEPLANASLTPSDVALQTYNSRLNTDRSGYFNVLSPDTSLIVKVTASGYREQLFRLRNNPAQNQLVLKPVLAGKAAGIAVRKKSTEVATNSNVQNAQPIDGWAAFEDYIEKNKVYPAENSSLAGEVVLSFQVNNQGRPANFNILQSLAKSYDEEAVRLIKDGPKWKILKGRRPTVTVTIRF